MTMLTRYEKLTIREIELALRDLEREASKARRWSKEHAERADNLDNAGIVLAKLLSDRKASS